MRSLHTRNLVSTLSLTLVLAVTLSTMAVTAFAQNYLGPIDVVASPDGKTLYYTTAPLGGHARIVGVEWPLASE